MTNPSEGLAPEHARQPPDLDVVKRRTTWPILLIGGATQFVLALDGTIMTVTLPQVQSDLGLDDGARSAVVVFYAFFHGLFLLLGGRAVDSWGYRRAFLIGMAGFGAASLLGGTAHHGTQLLIARGAQGGCAALLAPAVLALISTSFVGARERAVAFVAIGTIAICGTGAGLVLGGVLAEYANWRWCLLLNVPLAVVVSLLVVMFFRNPVEQGRPGYDLPGAGLSTAAFLSLGLGFLVLERQGAAVWVISLLLLGVLLTVAFVLVEQRVAAPLVPPGVLLNRTRALASLGNAVFVSGTLGGTLFLATYLEKLRGYDPPKTGFSLLPILLGVLAGGLVVTRLSEHIGLRPLIVVGALLAGAGMLLFGTLSLTADYWTFLLPSIILLGAGLGVLSVCLPDLALVGAKPGEAGSASAVFTAYGQVGGALGMALFSYVYTHAKAHVPLGASAELVGDRAAFTIAGVTLALVGPVVLFARPGRRRVG